MVRYTPRTSGAETVSRGARARHLQLAHSLLAGAGYHSDRVGPKERCFRSVPWLPGWQRDDISQDFRRKRTPARVWRAADAVTLH